ncbi:cupin domain-containing protein [Arthrobacter mobilis]|uniref:DUF861 domain-containing protein n=1 Tax=Arthrobacter mobilis TaxID=2724944 RepID=A0A7X6H9S7_9MICC|nr:cupin domain-containing protein [Arthrobacter mobilis]NKX53097.1 DUF861 domain-containing protein [Arthrobacter mobilis]
MSTATIHLAAAPQTDLGTPAPKPTSLTAQTEAAQEIWTADQLSVGVWECSPGTFTAVRDGYHEVCQLLAGRVTITADGQAPVQARAGDTIVMPAGWQGTWEVHETVRKTYVTLDLA